MPRLRTIVVLTVLCLAPASLPAQSPNAAVITVEVGTQRLIREERTIERVAIGDKAIADVNVLKGQELLITGKTLGLTSLLLWPRAARWPYEYRVRVIPVQDTARATQADPELARAAVTAGTALAGRLPNLLAHRRARLAAEAGKPVPDTSQVDLDSQVMTEIKIAEVSRTTMQQFGLNFLKNNPNTTVGFAGPGGLAAAGQAAPGSPISLATSGGFIPLRSAFNLVIGDSIHNILGVLSLLEGKGLARTLAEPSLVAHSGQTASFLAGGEFPVPVSQGGAASGAITIEYKEFGVRVQLTPTVLARDRIALKVAPEVSDLDFSAGIQIGGVAVPALTVRRTDTTVELGDGESFVISGLVSNNLLANLDKVPGLASLPILGAFFKSTQVSREQKELIMVVTPRLVRPLRRDLALPKLPGAKYDRYNPKYDQLLLREQGKFDQSEFGFSR